VTVPEFTYLTLRTLDTISRLPRYRGHLYNWYDTKTLAPLPPLFVSSVDSGNLVASLWTLQQGCLERLHLPVVQDNLAQGLLDYFEALADMRAFQRKSLLALRRVMRRERSVPRLLDLFEKALNHVRDVPSTKHAKDVEWFAGQARARLLMMREAVRVYTPWMLPEFSALRDDDVINLRAHWYHVPLDRTPEFIETLATRLQRISAQANGSGERSGLVQRLLELLADSRRHVIRLMEDLRRVAATAAKLAEEMDFAFLLNQRRKLLSAGFDADRGELHPACYDLLASESRTAVFVAVAKDDIPQESWFLLGRTHTTDHGQPVLLSWTGTMFEYMMPALWMRSYPNTLLERSRSAAVRSQQEYPGKRIPWGISESAYAKRDEAGNYQYHAFGIPPLALRHGGLNGIVISPYSTFLALQVEAAGALANLRRMAHKGWFGPYGFYESADFMPSARRSWRHRYELIRCWMAHHQGMILLSLANFLYDGIVQEWFHSDPRVQATELLLHEKPVSHARILRDYSAVA
jgi:hypothetical protein